MYAMDVFLQKFGLTRYDVWKMTGISQQTLSKANRKTSNDYSGKVLKALSEATGISPGEVLDSIFRIEKDKELFIVHDFEELRRAYKDQMPEFYVKGNFVEVMKEVKSGQLSDTARMGTELGSGGSSGIIEALYYFAYNHLKGGDVKQEKLKDDITKLYYIIMLDEETALLRLKSMYY